MAATAASVWLEGAIPGSSYAGRLPSLPVISRRANGDPGAGKESNRQVGRRSSLFGCLWVRLSICPGTGEEDFGELTAHEQRKLVARGRAKAAAGKYKLQMLRSTGQPDRFHARNGPAEERKLFLDTQGAWPRCRFAGISQCRQFVP